MSGSCRNWADNLYGYGPAAAPRQTAAAALLDAVQTITALDQRLHQHPLRHAWARAEQDIAVAAAAAEAGPGSADIALILRARLGASSLPTGHLALSDLDTRARAWAMVRQRKGTADLRTLVGGLTPLRGSRDLVGLADRVTATLARVSTASWELTQAGQGAATLTVSPGGSIDAGDVALAVPYALRRLGLTRTLLPSLSGRVRTLGVPLPGGVREGSALADAGDLEGQPLTALTRWAATLAAQARAGTARLNRLERYVAAVERQLMLVRRPQALRRLVGVGLSSWGLWAAQLARLTDVELSSAWRTLAQAAELGLVAAVRSDTAETARSRGDATVYAVPPWLHLAGLLAAPRGRPAAGWPAAGWPAAAIPGGQGSFAATAAAMADAAAAIAAVDALLARPLPEPQSQAPR